MAKNDYMARTRLAKAPNGGMEEASGLASAHQCEITE
jgi:hypothetical protein